MAFLNVFKASIFDKSGELIETKTIKTTFTKPKINSFTWNEGEYLVNPSSFMFKLSPFPFFFTYWFSSYQMGNPEPIPQKHLYLPILNAKDFYQILKSDVLKKLMAARKGWGNILTLRNILIFLALVGVGIYFMNGGSLQELAS